MVERDDVEVRARAAEGASPAVSSFCHPPLARFVTAESSLTDARYRRTAATRSLQAGGNNVKKIMTGLALLAMLAGCATTDSVAPVATAARSGAAAGFDPANLDRNVKACDDFYQFANGGWSKANPIPPAFSRWGNFNILAEKNRATLRLLAEEASRSNAPDSSVQAKVGDFYRTCMDESAIERAGYDPIRPMLNRIDAIRSSEDLQSSISWLHSIGMPVVFGFYSAPDARNTAIVVANASQGGLGLPERDYYFGIDERSKEIRAEYLRHVAAMLRLIGYSAPSADAAASRIMDFESRLADASMTTVELRDPNAIYNRKSLAELSQLTPRFSWPAFFNATGVKVDSIIVGQPKFFERTDALLAERSLDEWKDYLRWHVVRSAAPALSSPFETAAFDFNERFLEGKKEMLPRWRRCVTSTDAALGEALGQLYVAKAFPPEAKSQSMTMVRNLMAALRSDIDTLDWMLPETRQQALVKLEAFATKIGYPDKWVDYRSLQTSDGAYAENLLRAATFNFRRDVAKIGQAVDRSEWLLSPPTVNAYNNPPLNEIVFPAGILQPPFYSATWDDAYNYGGMGAVIGHELIHGFDDEGRLYDAKGNLADWWSEEDKKRFEERADCIVEQFNSFDLGMGDLRMNGKLVLGESIADLGGLSLAYAAYQKSLEGKPREIIDGFTPEQRFFLGWAQVWAMNATPEFQRLQVTTDPHPLSKYRVNGPLANMPEFHAAFGCQAPNQMVRSGEERCKIW
jgi:putative endopeptidase